MSVNISKILWRLTTPGGIRVKVVSREGNFTDEGSGASEVYIIRAEDLGAFVLESFPAPVITGAGLLYSRNRAMPGTYDTLITKKISWKALTPGRPIDPFATDILASARTYEDNLEVTIEYGTRPMNDGEPDPDDPRTFCEISSNTSASLISTPAAGKAEWADGTKVKDADVTIPLIESETEWTVRWPQIPYQYLNDKLIGRTRSLIGNVNSIAMKIFHNAPAETILFLGYHLQQQFTWRRGFRGQSPVVMELKFVEKNFKASDGTQVTHNHYFRPGTGYQRLKIDGTNGVYPKADLNTLFIA